MPVSETSDFTSYSKTGFGYDDHVLLRDTCLELDGKGVFFVQSNSYVAPVIELYSDIEGFMIEVVQMNRPINSKASKRGEVKEILVTNIPQKVEN